MECVSYNGTPFFFSLVCIHETKKANEDPESEEELEELAHIDSLLEKYDTTHVAEPEKYPQEIDYQLYLTVERIRIPEIIFQPSMIGVDQMGLGEAMYHILNQFPLNQQESLMKVAFLQSNYNILLERFYHWWKYPLSKH